MRGVGEARSDYAMAKRTGAQNRRRAGVPSHGAGADYHYRHEGDWLWMSELAWDLYRNDVIVGSIVDRAVEQTLQGGFHYDPETGDKKLDRDVRQYLAELVDDPKRCSPCLELDFRQQEEMVLRSVLVPGDTFGVPYEDGSVDLIEGHLCRSPKRPVKEKPVHGVEFVPGSRRRAAYWFLDDESDPFKQSITKAELTPYLAWDDDGEANIWHVRFPKRRTQTRGITAFAPIFNPIGYNGDLQFLQMVNARVQSMFAFIRSRSDQFDTDYMSAEQKLGADHDGSRAIDAEREYLSNRRQYSQVGVGSVIDSLPGETVTMASVNTPGNPFFQHYKTLLTFVGVNLGMPLVMALMDASETNFSGYRGAVDQARMGFRKNQTRLIRLWHKPWTRFQLRHWALGAPAGDPLRTILQTGRLRNGKRVRLFGGRWCAPGWPYIEPTKDAAADLLRRANSLESPRAIAKERGREIEAIFRETVEDNEAGYELAIPAAQRLIELAGGHGDLWGLVDRLLPLPTSQNTSVSIQSSAEPAPAASSEETDA